MVRGKTIEVELRIPKIFAHKQIHNPSNSLYSSPSLFIIFQIFPRFIMRMFTIAVYRTMQTILMGTISIILLFSNISGQILPLFSATTRSPISSASVKLCVTNTVVMPAFLCSWHIHVGFIVTLRLRIAIPYSSLSNPTQV